MGDQRASYNQDLQFKLRVGESGGYPGQDDLVIIGGGDKIVSKISVSLVDQNNPPPEKQVNNIKQESFFKYSFLK